ncbi:MAG: hypothetical protein RLZZ543_843 [Bacteroidota bacterium]|jgi:hypothetical protein
MRQLSLVLIFLIFSFRLFADEGMWLPMLLKQMNEKDMKQMGMKISAEDIYSVNKSSMKDAVVLFGRGCTGEVISKEGLLLTNHHCGFGQIQDHSSLDHDYLKDGFWAKNHQEELPNPGLTVTFIIRMEDVTARMIAGMENISDEAEREKLVAQRSNDIIAQAVANTHYEGIVKPMYNGNEYVLFVTEVFRDVRLVGAPPQTIGNFGKDSDNWMWPRHTADFSVFRIYAGKDNKPADYSPENVPFQPRYHFPISTAGIKENDFTMVYGFPARTNEYLTSYAVDQIVNLSNPLKVDLRAQRLDIMDKYMSADRATFIKYADKYSGVSNYHKKWAGESKGLIRAHAIEKKKEFETKFQSRVEANAAFSTYRNLLGDFEKEYAQLKEIQPEMDLFNEGVLSIEILRFANGFRDITAAPIDFNSEKGKEILNAQKERVTAHFKDYYQPLDRETMSSMLFNYYKYSVSPIIPTAFSGLKKDVSMSEVEVFTTLIFDRSILAKESDITALLANPDTAAIAKIKNDPAYQLAVFYFDHYRTQVLKRYNGIMARLIPMNRLYVKAQREVIPEKRYYPDANQSLRVAYGKTEGYSPADGVTYTWFTTADGILQKNNSGNSDYEIPSRLRELIEKKDFGPYADKKDGKLHTCFAASNHTTGGNSGSPVFNAKGQLIGTNFDRNWEGTMSDVYYDINQVRNITADIRYTLFIIDKFAGAGHLVKEMTLVP